MKVKEIPPNQTVKIGMHSGSCYVFVGKMKDFPAVDLERKDISETWHLFNQSVTAVKRSGKRPTKKALQLLIERAELARDLKPILDREVLDYRPSNVEDDTMIAIIPGVLCGRYWLVDETPRPFMVKDTNGAVQLIGEVYKGVVRDLTDAYVEYIRHGAEAARIRIQKLEAEIERNDYGMINDTSSLVKFARESAADQICSLGRPREMVEEVLSRL